MLERDTKPIDLAAAYKRPPEGVPSKAAPAPSEKDAKKDQPPKDLVREVKETIVFVVVLVLLLKLFVAEAFVIPTGSMAETLLGDHSDCTCGQCKYEFNINSSENNGRVVSSYVCPNCGYQTSDPREIEKDVERWDSGDRVLVAKYQFHLRDPKRFDVPVFKYPIEPYEPTEPTSMNYIKRLVGLGGETVAVYNGDLYVTTKLKYKDRPRPQDDKDLWLYEYMYPSVQEARDLFYDDGAEGGFGIVRKSPDMVLAMRRIVFDLDHQPKAGTGQYKTRWHLSPNEGAGWEMREKGFAHTGEPLGWVRYQHLGYGWSSTPAQQAVPITDFLAYNSTSQPGNWVPDLIVECRAEFGDAGAEVILELNKGRERFQARFVGGKCQIIRVAADEGVEKSTTLEEVDSGIKGEGRYHLRFANVDSRLTVWVDGSPLRFSDKAANYDGPPRRNFAETEADRERPVRIGAKGAVTCSRVQVWRDLYYTCTPPSDPRYPQRQKLLPKAGDMPQCDTVQTFYVQPGHYLMFGDNSASSSDSRSWGSVPERLLLGRAGVVYWPPSRVGVIE